MSSIPTLVLKQRRKVEKVIDKKIRYCGAHNRIHEKLYVSQTYIGNNRKRLWVASEMQGK